MARLSWAAETKSDSLVPMKIPTGHTLDQAQEKVAAQLGLLAHKLQVREDASLLHKFVSRLRGTQPTLQGLYIYGAVGRGKTMLMDGFYDSLSIERKQRWHFHAFMQFVHKRLKELSGSAKEQPIELLAREIASQARVVCFDEFHVTDIADAMILGRLFSQIFEYGTVVVITSNQQPNELYKDGLHRDRFLPFIEVLKQYCLEAELNGPVDYRRAILQKHRRYFSPIDAAARREMDQIFSELSDGKSIQAVVVEVNGRELVVKEAANGVARLSFAELCEVNRGASDYLALCDNFHTMLLENVHVMNEDMHNEAKRFITLIDILYDRDINLVISASDKPDQLYKVGRNSQLFQRTISRLVEMTGCC